MNPFLLLAVILVAGCATQPTPTAYDAPGFWMGLAHGVTAPVAFVVSLFRDVRIYAFPNSGVWYDFGFLLGLSAWGGGGVAATHD